MRLLETPPSILPPLLLQQFPIGHLHHVHQIAETHGLVDGEVAISMQDTVVDDVSAKTNTQDIVSGVTSRLAHEKQPVLGWLQLLHGFLARDLTVEPSVGAVGRGYSVAQGSWGSDATLPTRAPLTA